MNKTELISAIAKTTGQGWDATKATIEAFESEVKSQNEQGNKVSMLGFGSFDVAHTKARTGRNPGTGAEIQIPAKAKPKFTASDAYITGVNKAQAKV